MKKKLIVVVLMILGMQAFAVKTALLTVADQRDGQVYPVLKVNKRFWMGANLNFAMEKESWCYDYFGNPCNTYGRLYQWIGAMKACPEGWHLPSEQEWSELEIFYGLKKEEADKLMERGAHGKKMQEKNQGGFQVKLGGWKMHEGGYTGLNTVSFFWSSTEREKYNSQALVRGFVKDRAGVIRNYVDKTAGFSVRCVKD
jgi:uncharacterized protein (TIGR02145 family)